MGTGGLEALQLTKSTSQSLTAKRPLSLSHRGTGLYLSARREAGYLHEVEWLMARWPWLRVSLFVGFCACRLGLGFMLIRIFVFSRGGGITQRPSWQGKKQTPIWPWALLTVKLAYSQGLLLQLIRSLQTEVRLLTFFPTVPLFILPHISLFGYFQGRCYPTLIRVCSIPTRNTFEWVPVRSFSINSLTPNHNTMTWMVLLETDSHLLFLINQMWFWTKQQGSRLLETMQVWVRNNSLASVSIQEGNKKIKSHVSPLD